MAKKIAIEWDAKELRVVVATVRGGAVSISDIASTPLETTEPNALGETLKRLLHGVGVDKGVGLIALGRGKAELRELKLPPVPDAELPVMVRFQAVRTFAAAGEKSAIDYLPTRSDADGVRVVAAAVGPEELKSCALAAVPAGLSIERIVLRPLAAAALFRRHTSDLAGEVVLIDLLADEADIVILRDGTPNFVRSIRLPDDPAIRIRTLSGEVRRSLMACQEGQPDGDSARRIVLWGREAVHADEVKGLATALNTSVQTLDPFSLVEIEAKLKDRLPEHVGRLAPLLGLLDADARGGTDLIDFLNPRRPPVPKSQRGRYIAYGAIAATIVALGAFFAWKKVRDLDTEIIALKTAYDDLAEPVKAADLAMSRTARVESFLDGDVFWLDEIRRIAVNMPPAEEAIVELLSAKLDTFGGASITIDGGVTKSEIVSQFMARLSDDAHRVSGSGTKQVPNKDPYNWSYSEKIIVAPEFVRASHTAIPTVLASPEVPASPSDTSQDATLQDSTSPPLPTDEAPPMPESDSVDSSPQPTTTGELGETK